MNGDIPTPDNAIAFSRAWYSESDAMKLASGLDLLPWKDADSPVFHRWLARNLASAMAKGIQIGREWERQKINEASGAKSQSCATSKSQRPIYAPTCETRT